MRRLATVACVLALLLAIVSPTAASAATTTTAQRNAISWTWSYNAPGTSTYNCLAYALGITNQWVWPISWGATPSLVTVDNWMYTMGHSKTTSTSLTNIICYGKNGYITHFSKRTSSTTCRAKWGACERFNHGSWSPYRTTSYGLIYRYYK